MNKADYLIEISESNKFINKSIKIIRLNKVTLEYLKGYVDSLKVNLPQTQKVLYNEIPTL